MAALSKKLGQMRQWTGEKLGNAQRTETGDDFARLEQETNIRSEQTKEVFEACQSYLHSIGRRKEGEKPRKSQLDMLGSSMIMFGSQLPDSVYAQTLQIVGDAEEKIAIYQSELCSDFQSGYTNRLGAVLHDMKEFYSMKKKMENRRLDFDAKHNRAQKSKRENADIFEEANYAKAKYEESLNDVTQRMVRISVNEDDQLLDLLDFVDMQVNYYQRSLKVLLQLQSSLENVPRPSSSKYKQSSSENFNRKSSYDDDPPETSNRGPVEKKLLYAANAGSLVYPVKGPNGLQAPPNPRSHNSASGLSYLKKVRVTFDFDAEDANDLTIRKGDIVNVITEIDESWFKGEMADGTGRCGMFPSNYCETISSSPSIQSMHSRSIYLDPEEENGRPLSTSSNSSRISNAPATLQPSPAAQRVSSASRSVSNPVQSQSSQFSHKPSNTAPSTPPRYSDSIHSQQCSLCECDHFVPHAFKKGICNQCYHNH
ncbi:hypothetical protein HK096_004507 [Nowakowskiella sp. JEL0078]|nr:hypothetical protein HK096_004507 [Nowakowskiella sp. JEL0078]